MEIKHISTVIEPSIPLHALVKPVDAEDITNEKTRTLDLPLEIIEVATGLEYQNYLLKVMIQTPKICLHN